MLYCMCQTKLMSLPCFCINRNKLYAIQGDNFEANRTIYCLQKELSLECYKKNVLEKKVYGLQTQLAYEMEWKEETKDAYTQERKLEVTSLMVKVI